MRTAVTTLFILALTLPGVAQAPKTGGGDEAAIRRVLQDYDAARTRADVKAVAALFTEDGDQLTSASEWRRGRAQVEKGTAQSLTTSYKGGKYVTNVETVRMLGPGIALAEAAFEIANIAGGSRKGHTTFVLVKSGDRWQIALARSMVPTPAGATPSR
jgi:uncharacterized protein (TIGR02246 family)